MTTIIERLNRWKFQREIRGILNTPPAVRGRNQFAVLSMVHQRDILPYLLAIKTFVHFSKPERIILIADPSIDDADYQTLNRHVPGIEILSAVGFRRPALPIGGTWERLAAISLLCKESSIVQLDADTCTMAEPTEVISAAMRGSTFVIRSEAGAEIVSLDVAAKFGRTLLATTEHVQAVSEARLDELEDASRFRYVRGCSGFTGFGKNVINERYLDEISAQMRAIHGSRWDEWGTEQVTSNLLAASVPNSFMLPHPRYCNADAISPGTILSHYIGYARFVSRDYEHRARFAARELLCNG